jgi:hypothetical protein
MLDAATYEARYLSQGFAVDLFTSASEHQTSPDVVLVEFKSAVYPPMRKSARPRSLSLFSASLIFEFRKLLGGDVEGA